MRIATALQACLLILLIRGLCCAQSIKETVKLSINVATGGPCGMQSIAGLGTGDYETICQSGICVCQTGTGTISSNQIGRGDASLALTEDEGAALSTGNVFTTDPGLLYGGCSPFFGALVIDTTRGRGQYYTGLIYISGSACGLGSNANPAVSPMAGGWSQEAFNGRFAAGTFTGTWNTSTFQMTIQLAGEVMQ